MGMEVGMAPVEVSVGVSAAVIVVTAFTARVPSVQVSVVPVRAQEPKLEVKVGALTPKEVGGTGMVSTAPVLASGPRFVTV